MKVGIDKLVPRKRKEGGTSMLHWGGNVEEKPLSIRELNAWIKEELVRTYL